MSNNTVFKRYLPFPNHEFFTKEDYLYYKKRIVKVKKEKENIELMKSEGRLYPSSILLSHDEQMIIYNKDEYEKYREEIKSRWFKRKLERELNNNNIKNKRNKI